MRLADLSGSVPSDLMRFSTSAGSSHSDVLAERAKRKTQQTQRRDMALLPTSDADQRSLLHIEAKEGGLSSVSGYDSIRP